MIWSGNTFGRERVANFARIHQLSYVIRQKENHAFKNMRVFHAGSMSNVIQHDGIKLEVNFQFIQKKQKLELNFHYLSMTHISLLLSESKKNTAKINRTFNLIKSKVRLKIETF